MTIEEAEPHSIVPILYFAPGATHAPHHVPPESPARYAGHFVNVFPLDDRRYERFNAELAGRPQLVKGTPQLLYSGMRLTENSIIVLKNK